MELRTRQDGLRRQPRGENAPTVTVVFGGEEGGPDVGMVRVNVPAGGGMPAHRHGGSDVIVTPTAGRVTVSDGKTSVDVRVGDSALILKDEQVSLTNHGDGPAEIIVSAGPANFIAGIRAWPEARATAAAGSGTAREVHEPSELTAAECRALVRTETVGRVALTTPQGLRIVPVNYTVTDEAIIFRTAPYSDLGTHGPNTEVAFEVDQLDHETHEAWSVVATGRAEAIDDSEEIRDIRTAADPSPWAAGSRHLYLRLRWRELTGRRLHTH